jgi:hypothetical protein
MQYLEKWSPYAIGRHERKQVAPICAMLPRPTRRGGGLEELKAQARFIAIVVMLPRRH